MSRTEVTITRLRCDECGTVADDESDDSEGWLGVVVNEGEALDFCDSRCAGAYLTANH